VIAC